MVVLVGVGAGGLEGGDPVAAFPAGRAVCLFCFGPWDLEDGICSQIGCEQQQTVTDPPSPAPGAVAGLAALGEEPELGEGQHAPVDVELWRYFVQFCWCVQLVYYLPMPKQLRGSP